MSVLKKKDGTDLIRLPDLSRLPKPDGKAFLQTYLHPEAACRRQTASLWPVCLIFTMLAFGSAFGAFALDGRVAQLLSGGWAFCYWLIGLLIGAGLPLLLSLALWSFPVFLRKKGEPKAKPEGDPFRFLPGIALCACPTFLLSFLGILITAVFRAPSALALGTLALLLFVYKTVVLALAQSEGKHLPAVLFSTVAGLIPFLLLTLMAALA